MLPLLAAWVHDLDPYAIKLWDGGPIRWYGLSYLLGFAMGWLLIRRVCRVGVSTLSPKQATDLVVTVAVGIVIGGRLGYVLFYKPDLAITFTDQIPYWGLLAINRGGMASHGGIAGGIVACTIFAWRNRQSMLYMYDLMAFGAPLGLAGGRIANFINGELYGRPVSPDFPLAVKFPQEMMVWTKAHWEKVGGSWHHLPVEAIIKQIQSGNAAAIAWAREVLTPRHPSQLYAAGLEGLTVFVILLIAYRKPRPAGWIGSLFCVSYAIVRIIDEFWRMPDAYLLDEEFAAIGITRGQWLSGLILILGIVGLILAPRLGARLGGWSRTSRQTVDNDNQPKAEG